MKVLDGVPVVSHTFVPSMLVGSHTCSLRVPRVFGEGVAERCCKASEGLREEFNLGKLDCESKELRGFRKFLSNTLKVSLRVRHDCIIFYKECLDIISRSSAQRQSRLQLASNVGLCGTYH